MKDLLNRIKQLSPLKQQLLARQVGDIRPEVTNRIYHRSTKPNSAKHGRKRLVVYIVSKKKDKSIIGELRNHLIRSLPKYMVPSTILMMETLPCTPKGKIDRLSLPRPNQIGSDSEELYCQSPNAGGGFSRLDFPLANLDYEDLTEAMISDPQQKVGCLASGIQYDDVELLSPLVHGETNSFSTSGNNKEKQPRSESQKIASNAKKISLIQKDSMEYFLNKIWQQILGIKSIGADDHFFQLGGSSISALQLLAKIEESTGKRLPIATLYQAPTIRKISAILKDKGWSPNWSSLVLMKSGDFTCPLFAVPAVASTVLQFEALIPYLTISQAIYGVQPIGFDGGINRPHDNVKDMAAHYIKEILTVQPTGPYFLLGRCFGSKVIFEMAHQFLKQNQKVALLGIIDSEPPRHINRENSLKNSDKPPEGYLRKSLYHLNKGKLTSVLKNKLISSTTALLSRRQRYVQRVIQAHNKANRSYVGKFYDGKITLIRSEKSHNSPNYDWHKERWSKLSAGMDYQIIPGNHRTILQEPNIQILAKAIIASIEKAQRQIEEDLVASGAG